MIPSRELLELRTEWALDVGVIEKDYVLGWLLAGVANNNDLAQGWLFKGGTCLRKCYYETYRFSEDLDFTVVSVGLDVPETLLPIFRSIRDWLAEESGIQIIIDESTFRRRQNLRGNPTTEARIAYRGPNPPRTLPKVKIDITADEAVVDQPVLRPIGHQYSDTIPARTSIRCYSLLELFAEKLRALAERCRPRDLYDVVHMHRHPDLIGRAPEVGAALARKCTHAGIAVPTLEAIRSSPLRQEVEAEWTNMLGHQLPRPLPPFANFWSGLDDVFSWLAGQRVAVVPRRAEMGANLDPAWVAPRAITTWRRGFPFELIRYAGANRLKIDIDYQAEDGRWGPRRIEPYSLRRTRDGNLLLFVVNDRGQLRGYRADRIAGVRPTEEAFSPRFLVEF
ncbi:MAG: WYL domain-containing protein [Chloroflexi bacterium]|nr:MAG: WYL domain-containing protein [Chloroflexota bacterium]